MSSRKRAEAMESKEPKDPLQEEQVLPLRLPSLSRTLALNFEQLPTAFSDSVWEGHREGLHSVSIISC